MNHGVLYRIARKIKYLLLSNKFQQHQTIVLLILCKITDSFAASIQHKMGKNQRPDQRLVKFCENRIRKMEDILRHQSSDIYRIFLVSLVCVFPSRSAWSCARINTSGYKTYGRFGKFRPVQCFKGKFLNYEAGRHNYKFFIPLEASLNLQFIFNSLSHWSFHSFVNLFVHFGRNKGKRRYISLGKMAEFLVSFVCVKY